VWPVLFLTVQGACAWRVCISVECRAGTLLRLQQKSGVGEVPDLRVSVECGCVYFLLVYDIAT
jgi:hypothetical protein